MSYILDALKKADQEHFIGSVPDLATPQEVNPAQPRSYRWLWVVVILLSVNAVLVVLLLNKRGTEVAEVPVTVPAQVAEEPEAALTRNQVVPTVEQASEVPLSEAPTPERSLIPENKPILTTGGVVVLPEPANVQDSGPLILPKEETSVQMSAGATAIDNSQVQNWLELPQEFRNKINLPRLDVHVYSEEPQGRFILINLKKYREGETLPNGLVLEEILPDGMILFYLGERFRVKK